MFTTESEPRQTETQATSPAVQSDSGPKADDGRTPQALWAHLRHELRTPLNAIIGYSELLLGDADDLGLAAYVSDLNQILSAGQQLLEIINVLRISLYGPDDHEISDELYGKVVTLLTESPSAFLVHFTSVPPEAETFLAKFLGATLN